MCALLLPARHLRPAASAVDHAEDLHGHRREDEDGHHGDAGDLPGLPGGVFGYPEQWVESRPIKVPGHTFMVAIRGRLDNVIVFDDGTYGIADRKTCGAKDEHVPLYARQLHAYAIALEQPAPGKLALAPVSRLGLMVFEPNAFAYDEPKAALSGPVTWIDVPRDDGSFMAFLAGLLDVLEQPEPPPAASGCAFCGYRTAGGEMAL
jgi:hypothetical protein